MANRLHFTQPRLAKLSAPNGREVTYWDTEVPKLGCRVHPGGKRVFVLRYYANTGRQRWLTLGVVGEIGVEAARKIARDRLAEASAGDDPASRRDEVRQEPTVAQLAHRYLSEYVNHRNASSARPGIEGRVRKFIIAELGQLKLSELSRARVQAFHHAMRDTPTQANRVLAALSKMCNLAISTWQLPGITQNPCTGLDKHSEIPNERHFGVRELQAIGSANKQAQARNLISGTNAGAIWFCALTGLRRGEILDLRWDA